MKNNEFIKRISAIAMSGMLTLSVLSTSAIPAFADETNPVNVDEASGVYIGKKLNIAEGTEIPEGLEFTYRIKAVGEGSDDETSSAFHPYMIKDEEDENKEVQNKACNMPLIGAEIAAQPGEENDKIENVNEAATGDATGNTIAEDVGIRAWSLSYDGGTYENVRTDADNVKVLGTSSKSIIDDLKSLKDQGFTHAGIYVYEISEIANSYGNFAFDYDADASALAERDVYTGTTGKGEKAVTETVEYSKASYKIYFYVVEQLGDNGKPTGDFEVKDIVAKKTSDDDGSTDGDDIGAKIDPTVSPTKGEGGEEEDDPEDEGDATDPDTGKDRYSGLSFDNTYLKKNSNNTDVTEPPVDPENPGEDEKDARKSPLVLSKVVTGDFADKSQVFKFKVTVTKPATLKVDGDKVYYAYIVDKTTGQRVELAEGQKQYDHKSTEDAAENDCYAFTSGVAIEDIGLMHNQTLCFTDIDQGASFDVEEALTDGYNTEIDLTGYGLTVENKGKCAKEKVGSCADADSSKRDIKEAEKVKPIVMEEGSGAAYTNKYEDISVTGIITNNLPFVMLMVLAGACGIGFAVVKGSRKPEEA